MRVVIMATGTAGDVFPYTGLADRIQAAGHDVVLAVPEYYRPPIEAAGLKVLPIDADIRDMLRAGPGTDQDRKSRGLAHVTAYVDLAKRGSDVAVQAFDSLVAAARGADVLLVSTPLAPHGYLIAKAMGIPSMGVYVVPTTPTREFSPVWFGGRSFGPIGNKLAGPAGMWPLSLVSQWVKVFQRRLALPVTTLFAVEREMRVGGWPIRYGYSRRSCRARRTGPGGWTWWGTGGRPLVSAGTRRTSWSTSSRPGHRRCW
ncbi:hypothetical protein GCM10029964_055700 [Kibdelosporangium lantanae]